MINVNFLALALASIVPLAVGFLWYNPKVMGGMWIRETGKTEEELRAINPAKVFGFTFLFSFLIAFSLLPIVVHQYALFSMLQNAMQSPDLILKDASTKNFAMMMEEYGNEFRTFKHGVFHGLLETIIFVLPIIGITALFEAKSWKYIFIHFGYFSLTLMLMGGIISAWK